VSCVRSKSVWIILEVGVGVNGSVLMQNRRMLSESGFEGIVIWVNSHFTSGASSESRISRMKRCMYQLMAGWNILLG
jgi:hypothetical protein